jgi:hypothetical protein
LNIIFVYLKEFPFSTNQHLFYITLSDAFMHHQVENLVERLVTETNNYAKQMTEEKPDGNVGFSWNFHDLQYYASA